MSSTIKTLANSDNVDDFINNLGDDAKRDDCFVLLEMYQRATGDQPKMWGSSIIGFGQYHYKSERSAQEGDWPLAAFSPRKQNLTLYINLGLANYDEMLANLGKHKVSKACLYINKLSDVNLIELEKLIARSYQDSKANLVT